MFAKHDHPADLTHFPAGHAIIWQTAKRVPIKSLGLSQQDLTAQFTLETGAEAHSRATKQVHFLTAQPKMDMEME